MTAPIDNPDAPSTDAYEEYDRSLDRLVMLGEPVNDQVRAAYAAGYKDGRAAERYQPGIQATTEVRSDTWFTLVEPT